MREIGLVKWYGGFQRKYPGDDEKRELAYGYVATEEKGDIRINKENIISPVEMILKDTFVTFELYFDKKKNRFIAKNIRAFEEEFDYLPKLKNLIEQNREFKLKALAIYLTKVDESESEKYLYDFISSNYEFEIKKKFASNLPSKFLMKYKDLRGYLDITKRIEICLQIIDSSNSLEISESIASEALDCINNLDTLSRFRMRKSYLKKIPCELIFNCNVLKEKLYDDEYFELLIEIANAKVKNNLDYEEIITEIKGKISLAYYESSGLAKLPFEILSKHKDLRNRLQNEKHFEICEKILEDNNHTDIKEIVEEMIQCSRFIDKKNATEYWNRIPEKYLLKWPDLLTHVPTDKCIALFILNYQSLDTVSKNYIADIIASKLKNENSNKNWKKELSLIPESIIIKHYQLFELLESDEQIELIWNYNRNREEFWNNLNDKTKLFLIYRSLSENLNIEYMYNNIEGESLIIRNSLILIKAKDYEAQGKKAFSNFHNEFIEYVVDLAWSSNEKLDFSAFLPKCDLDIIDYCEGRPWPTNEDIQRNDDKSSRAFCPRTGHECRISEEQFTQSDFYIGARLYANRNLNWKNWSLLELLDYSKIKASVVDLRSNVEYVPKLCGWINRLNEIRLRLKCSFCSKPLVPNYKYAKNFAAYNVTVASCSESENPHDKNIYFNHCWYCSSIIDSRECTIQIDNMYVCINCASGPQENHTYRQGSICPKCGGSQIKSTSSDGRRKKCLSCGHEFRIPTEKYLTGH